MVALDIVHQSNAHLPASLTAVFVGGTSGIGLYTLLAFARHCQSPTIYFVGRSQSAADTILADLQKINANGTYHFIQSDISLIKNVDVVCKELKSKLQHINLLVLSQGTLTAGTDTEEGLHTLAALVLHSRTRFTLNLLPLLQAAPPNSLRRVLTIFAGTKEGPITVSDLQGRTLKNPLTARGQATTTVTLLLEEAAKRAPDVSFVHDYPGFVRSNIGRGGGLGMFVMRVALKVLGPLWYVPNEESGERHLYLGTSGRYAPKEGDGVGVAVEKGGEVAVGDDGVVGSGVYVVDEKCESADERVVQVLREMREAKGEWVWEEIRKDFVRITGTERL